MYKVLIVDDEPIILDGLKHLIHWDEYGLEIAAQASNGADALKLLESQEIHILITDIKMPVMNGIELIRHVVDRKLKTKCIILSGYDDFQFVKEAAKLGIENYLLKSVDENELVSTLVNTVSKIENELYRKIEYRQGINILRDNILHRWLTDDISEQELVERSKLTDINISSGTYKVAIVKICAPVDEKQSKFEDKSLLRFSVCNICSEIIGERNLGTVFCDISKDIVIIFNNTIPDKDASKPVNEALMLCISNINTLLKTDIFITVGSEENSYRTVHRSYYNAGSLQEYNLIMPANNIVYYEDIQNTILGNRRFLKIDYQKLHGFVLSRSREHVLDFIDDVYSQLQELDGLTPSYIQSVTIELLININTKIKESSFRSDPFYGEFADIFANVLKISTLNELKERIKEVYLKCQEVINAEEEQTSPVIKKIIHYLKDNYAENISLKTIAKQFNINNVYLGQLFKKDTGETFNTYLNNIRIEKAKELLANSNLKINEVCNKVGYFNTSHFITNFKKVCGVSPSEFKGDV